jgi:hypothetical protein
VKLKNLTKFAIAQQYLYKKVGYFAEKCYDITGNLFTLTDDEKVILIVARKHYSEEWQTYPALSAKELKAILALQVSSNNESRLIHQYFVNKDQDGFDVKTISFSKELIDNINDNTVLIPETELLATVNNERVAYHLITPSGELFWAKSQNQIYSVYRQGLLSNSESFKMSIGYPSEINVEQLDQSQYLELLKYSLNNTPIPRLVNISSFSFTNTFDFKVLHSLYWGPAITATVFVLLVNGYYLYKNSSLEEQLLTYDTEINQLLSMKVEQDRSSAFLDVINKELASYELVHGDWSIAYEASKQNMHIQQFRKRDDNWTMRGKSDDASKVLAAINVLPEVSSAVFRGPVRKSRGKDAFVIELQMAKE